MSDSKIFLPFTGEESVRDYLEPITIPYDVIVGIKKKYELNPRNFRSLEDSEVKTMIKTFRDGLRNVADNGHPWQPAYGSGGLPKLPIIGFDPDEPDNPEKMLVVNGLLRTTVLQQLTPEEYDALRPTFYGIPIPLLDESLVHDIDVQRRYTTQQKWEVYCRARDAGKSRAAAARLIGGKYVFPKLDSLYIHLHRDRSETERSLLQPVMQHYFDGALSQSDLHEPISTYYTKTGANTSGYVRAVLAKLAPAADDTPEAAAAKQFAAEKDRLIKTVSNLTVEKSSNLTLLSSVKFVLDNGDDSIVAELTDSVNQLVDRIRAAIAQPEKPVEAKPAQEPVETKPTAKRRRSK